MKVAVFGGTGFVGRYLIDALLAAGHEPALLVRAGSESKVNRREDVRIVAGDLATPPAIDTVLENADAVIYNIGILREYPRKGITFERLQYRGTVRVIEAARRVGVARLILMSANGVRFPGTPYQETKYRAEEFARHSGMDVTICRPSVIFGDPRGTDEFATRLHRDMVATPLPGIGFHNGLRPRHGAIRLSPVHVEDVARAFVAALEDPQTIGKTYTLGGPESLRWTEILKRIAAATGREKLILPLPIGAMRLGASLFDWLPLFPVTRDQLTMLAQGNEATADELASLIRQPPAEFSSEALAYLR